MDKNIRTCGDCSVCCTIGAVSEIGKPPHAECQHQGWGCGIYGRPERPQVCGTFLCSWMYGWGDDDDRPDKSGVLASIGKWAFIIEARDGALENGGRYMTATLARNAPMPVIVVDHASMPPNDTGDRTVVRRALLGRTKRMRGRKLGSVDGHGIYELVKNGGHV